MVGTTLCAGVGVVGLVAVDFGSVGNFFSPFGQPSLLRSATTLASAGKFLVGCVSVGKYFLNSGKVVSKALSVVHAMMALVRLRLAS